MKYIYEKILSVPSKSIHTSLMCHPKLISPFNAIGFYFLSHVCHCRPGNPGEIVYVGGHPGGRQERSSCLVAPERRAAVGGVGSRTALFMHELAVDLIKQENMTKCSMSNRNPKINPKRTRKSKFHQRSLTLSRVLIWVLVLLKCT